MLIDPQSNQKIDFHRAMEIVADASREDPMRGLLWLASVKGRQSATDNDPKVLSFADELISRQISKSSTELHRMYSDDEITQQFIDLPRSMTYRPSDEWLGAPIELRLRSEFFGVRLSCHGLGSGPFDTPIQSHSWSVTGIALESNGYALSPEMPRGRSAFPTCLLATLCNQWNLDQALRCPDLSDVAFRRPLGTLAPAIRDVEGRVYDVADVVMAKLDGNAIDWLVRTTLQCPDLDGRKKDVLATYWGTQAARLADIARFQYATAYADQPWASHGLDPSSQSNRVSNAIVSIVHEGGALTPAIWRDRYFGPDDRPEMRALALAVLDHTTLSDDQKMSTLQALHDMGHDVVVAHRDRKEFADDGSSSPKVYKELPLDVAVQFDLSACVLALLDWGADSHAPVGLDKPFSPMEHSMARENDGLAMSVHQILRAHEAKRYANDALAEMEASFRSATP